MPCNLHLFYLPGKPLLPTPSKTSRRRGNHHWELFPVPFLHLCQNKVERFFFFNCTLLSLTRLAVSYLLSTYYVLGTMPGLGNHQKRKQLRFLPLQSWCSQASLLSGAQAERCPQSHPMDRIPFLHLGFLHTGSWIPFLSSSLFFSVGGTSVLT